MGGARFSRPRHARVSRGLLLAALVLVLAVPACSAGDYEPYATAEDAAGHYATGVLVGDTEMASRSVGASVDEEALASARVDLFGIEDAVPDGVAVVRAGADSVVSPGGRSQRANLFEVDSYKTADGVVVVVESPDRAPEIWVSDTEPWRVIPMSSQATGQLFVKILLLGLLCAVVIGVVVAIRMADNEYD